MSMKIFFPLSMYRMKVNGLATTMNIFKFVAVSPRILFKAKYYIVLLNPLLFVHTCIILLEEEKI